MNSSKTSDFVTPTPLIYSLAFPLCVYLTTKMGYEKCQKRDNVTKLENVKNGQIPEIKTKCEI